MNTHPVHMLMAKAQVGLMERTARSEDELLLPLMASEWARLCREWGTSATKEIQLGLMLSNTPSDIESPVSALLYTLGAVGITPWWKAIRDMRNPEDEPPEEDSSLVRHLEPYIMQRVNVAWHTGSGCKYNKCLADGIRELVRQGRTLQGLLHPDGGWWIDMPAHMQLPLYDALEFCQPDVRRYAIRFDGESQSRLEAQAEVELVGDEERWQGPHRKPWRRRVCKRKPDQIGLSGVLSKVESYSSEREMYSVQLHTGRIDDFLNLSHKQLQKRLLSQRGVFLPCRSAYGAKFPSTSEGVPCRQGRGWWFRFTGWQSSGEADLFFRMSGYFLEPGRLSGQVFWDELTGKEVYDVLEKLRELPHEMQAEISEEAMGNHMNMAVAAMHPQVYSFWERTESPPDHVRERQQRHRDHLQQQRIVKPRKMVQQLIGAAPISAAVEVERPQARRVRYQAPVLCRIWGGGQTNRTQLSNGTLELGRGRAVWRPKEGVNIQVEYAKLVHWKERCGLSWEQMIPLVVSDVSRAEHLETECNFLMPAWQLLSQIRDLDDYDQLVGPPAVMADPRFRRWIPADQWTSEVSSNLSVIVLDAFESDQQIQVLHTLSKGGQWAVLANRKNLTEEVNNKLDELAPAYEVLPSPEAEDGKTKQLPKVYSKGFWKLGSKQVCRIKQGGLWIWRGDDAEDPELEPVQGTPIFSSSDMDHTNRELYPSGGSLFRSYAEALPSGPYMHIPGQVFYTDGSKKTLPDGTQLVGAGGYCRNDKAKSFYFRVGGEAAAIRGEMAAIAWATHPDQADIDEDLTIFTDSKTTMDIVARWRRRDFAPRAQDEKHWDILQDLLENLLKRTAKTTFVWVKAHSGDVGNELADHWAGLGTSSDTFRWERETTPLALHRFTDGTLISPSGWSKAASKQAIDTIGQRWRARLTTAKGAISTSSLVKTDRGRRFLGHSLTDWGNGLSEFDRRSMLQGRSCCFPTQCVVARYKKGEVSEACKLCGAERETYGHVQVECVELSGAQTLAHDMIAKRLLDEIQRVSPDLEIQREQTLGEWLDECPADLASFKPDAFIYSKPLNLIIIWEFTRGMADHDQDFNMRESIKRQAYHGVELAIRRAFPTCQVQTHAYVMGVLTSIREEEWFSCLGKLKIEGKAAEEVVQAAFNTCVRANGAVLEARAVKLAAFGQS
mmetsp:Transcript_69333/g.144581  ORF Transcript_69333/g.144581 Transcript_69333/m.144581 type:complete len:1175 (+) Transcript_69333:2-3526(+)